MTLLLSVMGAVRVMGGAVMGGAVRVMGGAVVGGAVRIWSMGGLGIS